MDKLTFGGILIAFVGVIVALSLLPQIATNTQELTSQNYYFNDTLTIPRTASGLVNTTYTVSTTQAYSDWRSTSPECVYTGVVIKVRNGTTLTDTTDYVIDTQAGTLTFKNTGAVQQGNVTNVSTANYYYCLQGYAKDSATRGISSLIILITAIALMGFVAYYFFQAWRGN